MTEDDARDWAMSRHGPAKIAQLGRFVDLVIAENDRQNLIAPSTITTIWARHVVDSAQLLDWAPARGRWLDVGTGGGFPGMVAAILYDGLVTMVEPRRKRADFLRSAVGQLGLEARVHAVKVENVEEPAEIISARAVASPEKLLHATRHCATPSTRWLLPRGSGAGDPSAPRGMMFHVKQSITDPSSRILIVEQARS